MSATKNKLTITTPSDLEIVMSREFNAPRSLVFEALTKAEHVSKWWGPGCVEMISCEIDSRVGGSYRFVVRGPDGGEHPFKGVIRELDPPSRLVQTQIYDVEPYSQFEALMTTILEDLGHGTKLTVTILHQTKEARDGHLGSGMEQGAAMSYDQLEELLEELQGGTS